MQELMQEAMVDKGRGLKGPLLTEKSDCASDFSTVNVLLHYLLPRI